jgi:hypothetical protein
MAIYLSLGLHKGRLGEAFSPQKRTSSTSKHENSVLFLFLWVLFALLDPDPKFECGSGSGSSNSNPYGSGSATLLERPPNHQSMALWVSGAGIWRMGVSWLEVLLCMYESVHYN